MYFTLIIINTTSLKQYRKQKQKRIASTLASCRLFNNRSHFINKCTNQQHYKRRQKDLDYFQSTTEISAIVNINDTISNDYCPFSLTVTSVSLDASAPHTLSIPMSTHIFPIPTSTHATFLPMAKAINESGRHTTNSRIRYRSCTLGNLVASVNGNLKRLSVLQRYLSRT